MADSAAGEGKSRLREDRAGPILERAHSISGEKILEHKECQVDRTLEREYSASTKEGKSTNVKVEDTLTEPLGNADSVLGRRVHEEINLSGTLRLGGDSSDVTVLLDTGAENSFVNENLLVHFPGLSLEPTHLSVRTLSGELVPATGRAHLELEVSGSKIEHDFIFMAMTEDVVMGMDIIASHRVEWSWDDHTVCINDVKIPCGMPTKAAKKAKRTVRVVANETMTVPANSELVMWASIVGKAEEAPEEGLISAQIQFLKRHPVALASTLVKRVGHLVPVRFLNPTDSAELIVVGENLAILSEVKEVGEQTTGRHASCEETIEGLPEPLQKIVDETKGSLSEEEQQKVENLLHSYRDVFAITDQELGRTNVVEHAIHLSESAPIKQRVRREPMNYQGVVKEELDKMLEKDVIEPSTSPWASPVVLVKKKDGSVRFCIDYRQLNDVTVKDAYPLPKIEENIDALKGSKWFSTLDLASGYWQVAMSEEDKEKTAFCTKYGLFQWKVMPFGLCNAPSTFERLMERVLQGLQWESAVLYLDDIIVFSGTVDDHIQRLEEVFQRLRGANLRLKPKKCHLFKEEVQFLGHVVSEKGVATDPEKTKAVQDWETPRSVKDVKAFLGFTGYYRRFIPNYADKAEPLVSLLRKNVPFQWKEAQRSSFETLKKCLVGPTVLAYPDPKISFVLDTDASDCGIGGVLSQVQDGVERVVAYGSRSLSAAEKNYCTTRKELLAIVWFMEHFRHYLLGGEFLVRTDHGALRWLLSFKEPEGQIARWLERLQVFNFVIAHRPGTQHGNADGLSRRPCPETCKQCTRKMQLYGNTQLEGGEVRSRTVRTSQMGRRERKRARQTEPEGEIDNEWLQEIRKWQEEDPIFREMNNWSTKRPEWEQVSIQSAEMKYWWSRYPVLFKENDIWKIKWILENGKESVKLLIPEKGRDVVMEEHHGARLAGHLGRRRTTLRLKKSPYFWPGIDRAVRLFCAKCETCRTTKPHTKRTVAPLVVRQTTQPMDRVGIDVMGPFPITKKGNKCILVVGDYATKWLEAYPLPDHRAETIAECLVTNFISRFGIPRRIHSDQGRDFESNLFQELCRLLGIDKTRTSPWQPSSNGYIERFNATLQAMLRTEVSDKQDDWDENIPVLTMAYRSSVHETTGETPNMMMLGRELPMPSHLLACPDSEEAVTAVEYVERLKRKMQEAHESAQKQGLAEMRRYKEMHDKKCFLYDIKENQRVWVYHPMRMAGKSPKLQSAWEKDVFVTQKKLGDVTWLVKNDRTGKYKVLHVNKLLPVVGTVTTRHEPTRNQKEITVKGSPLERVGLGGLVGENQKELQRQKESEQEHRRSPRLKDRV